MLVRLVTYIHLQQQRKIFPTLWIFPHLTVAGGSWTRPSAHPPSPSIPSPLAVDPLDPGLGARGP